MVIDTHCHIIPGVDDGAENMEESMRMLQMEAREGIGAVIATPHFEYGINSELLEKRQKQFIRFCECAESSGTSVKIYPGNEIFYSDSIIESLMNGDAWTLNHTRYVLVEFPVYAEYSHIQSAVRRLQYAGYWPVLAHIERYEGLRKKEHVEELVDMGAYMQVNSSAVTGKNGWKIRQYVKKLLHCDLIHLLGTDSHGCEHRKPEMQKCLSCITKSVGSESCHRLAEENPAKIIRGEQING
ncbi:MAG: CpsB/CapC family capsule biosynthesis tyrosine phosphatase [Lachnospiraceae bacterium]|nr:CpsB/CapC family capsule biosynthesis tyrosine phosphatase [Lachnospiraceae bacterium]